MKHPNCLMTAALAMLLCGCPTTNSRRIAQPGAISVQGVYVHPGSRITFPEAVGTLRRDEVWRYDADGRDVSAAYNCRNALHPLAATVYVYPAPSLTSIGSPPEVIAAAQVRLSENEFERRKQEILHSHSNAKLVEQRDTVRTEKAELYPGKLAIFEFEEIFAGSKTSVRSHLYLFCYVRGKWTVKYRFTHPATVDAAKEIQEFIDGLSWYGTGA